MKKLMKIIEEQQLSTREFLMLGLCNFLLGVVIGMLLSPKGKRVVGSHNGNNNVGYVSDQDGNCEEIKKKLDREMLKK